MSASPVDPESLPQELKDGLIASILGGLGMAARLLLEEREMSLGWTIRQTCAASLVALFAGFFLQEHVQSSALRYSLLGIIGWSAPQVAEKAASWLRDKMDAKTKASPTGGKKNAKRPGRRKRS